MEQVADIPVIGTLVVFVIPFLIVLSIVVFVHEFGHYIVGKWTGIKSEVFSIGFGPSLFSWTDRQGTRWQVAALPLGGFVKFTGDMDPASAGQVADADLAPDDRARAFHNAPLAARAATVAAGPVFNFILAAVLIAALAMTIGRPSDLPIIGELSDEAADLGFRTGDRVLSIGGTPVEDLGDIVNEITKLDGETVPAVVERDGARQEVSVTYDSEPLILGIFEGEPADLAGLEPGDLMVAIDGKPVRTYYEMRMLSIDRGEGEPIEVTVLRDGRELTVSMIPEMVEREHPVTGEEMMLPTMGIHGGLQGLEQHREVLGPLRALPYGAVKVWEILYGTVSYLGAIIAGTADASQLGGPIGIAKISGQAFLAGVASMTWLIAVLSASIGLINLFPIPILDGGHLMFYALEAVRGRPVGEAAMRVGNMIGLSLVLLLMVFATYNDLLRV